MGRTESYLLAVIGVAAGVTVSALAMVQPSAWAGWYYLLWGGGITLAGSLLALSMVAFLNRRKAMGQDNDPKKVGDISVAMGDGNTVGHIGHKVYQGRPPGPGSMIQDGRVVGEVDAPFHAGENLIGFRQIVGTGDFIPDAEFVWGNLRLRVYGFVQQANTRSFGQLEKQMFGGVTCSVVGQLTG